MKKLTEKDYIMVLAVALAFFVGLSLVLLDESKRQAKQLTRIQEKVTDMEETQKLYIELTRAVDDNQGR